MIAKKLWANLNTPLFAPTDADARRAGLRTILKRLMIYAIVTVVAIYLLWCSLLFFMQGKLIYPAHLAAPALDQDALPYANAHRLVRETEVGRVEAFFVPASNASADQPAPLVVFCHGNGEIADYQQPIVQFYTQRGINVLIPEYRGYARSAGTPNQYPIHSDISWFLDETLKRPEVDDKRLIFHGRSLGGGVATYLTTHRKPDALILQSTFTSVRSFATDYYVPGFLVRSPFRTEHRLPELNIPTLIAHGNQDRVIPFAHGKKLHELAPHATFVEFVCDHNDFPGAGNDTAWEKAQHNFLAEHQLLNVAGDREAMAAAETVSTGE